MKNKILYHFVLKYNTSIEYDVSIFTSMCKTLVILSEIAFDQSEQTTNGAFDELDDFDKSVKRGPIEVFCL